MTSIKKGCWLSIAIIGYFAFASISAFAQANDDLMKMSQDANQWVIPLGDYSGTRHSTLTQINAQNAYKLHVAWTMSTGALRGHEGQPLVVGNTQYGLQAVPSPSDPSELTVAFQTATARRRRPRTRNTSTTRRSRAAWSAVSSTSARRRSIRRRRNSAPSRRASPAN